MGERENEREASETGECSDTTSVSRSCSPSASSTSSDVEDAEDYKKGGYHPTKIGDTFKQGKYVVVKKLGWGHFSTVWLVKSLEEKDGETGKEVFGAMKIQKSASHYTEAAMDEVKILKQIKEKDPLGQQPVANLLDWFEHLGPNGKHVCIVLESLGDNLLTLVKMYDYSGIPMEVVKMVARSTLAALDFLHSKLDIIHTDLKPENILLVGKVPKLVKKKKKKKSSKKNKKNGGGEDSKSKSGSKNNEKKNEKKKSCQDGSNGNGQHDCKSCIPPGGGGGGGGKIAQALASGIALTKNQKKKLKKKQKKLAAQQQKLSASQGKESCCASEKKKNEATDHPGGTGKGEAETREREAKNGKSSKTGSTQPASEKEEEVLSHREILASIPKECKVIDLGNACWTYKKFTSDIQTRQYRCPEVILGAAYSTPADIWSLACIIFELITGDYLFEPKSSQNYSRDEDHLALFQEALGKIPKRLALKGKFARDFFNRHGELRHIKKLQHWPLVDVFVEKYGIDEEEASELSSFLLPMLEYEPTARATAKQCLEHPFLKKKVKMGEKSCY